MCNSDWMSDRLQGPKLLFSKVHGEPYLQKRKVRCFENRRQHTVLIYGSYSNTFIKETPFNTKLLKFKLTWARKQR